MKKVVIALAMALVINCAQALTFTWGTGPSTIENAANVNLPVGSYVYLVWDTAGDGFDGVASGQQVLGDDVIMGSGALTLAGAIGTQTVTFSDGQSYTTGAGGSVSLSAGQAGVSMYLVAVDTTTWGAATMYNASTVLVRDMTPASGSPVTAYSFADASMLPSGWVAIPEPTSMALLALGVAAVGLRRRFRK